MDVNKSLIALSISLALAGGTGVLQAAVEDDDSVESWGRWAVLSPAAGAEDVIAFAPAGGNDIGRCEASANCPDPNPPTPTPTPVSEEGPCQAGQACGFARIDTRPAPSSPTNGEVDVQPLAVGGSISGNASPGNGSDVGYFELNLQEGEGNTVSYRVNPGETDEITSDTMAAIIDPTNYRSNDRSSNDRANGSVVRDGEDNPVMSQGFWRQVSDDVAQSGEYVWGIAATADQMSSLMDQLIDERGDMVATYQGLTARNGGVVMEVDFGSATWTGEFSGAVAFDAGGDVLGSSFVSDSAQFSDNVATGIVEGGFVNAGNNAIGAYDVTDLDGLRDADVFNTVRQIDSVTVD